MDVLCINRSYCTDIPGNSNGNGSDDNPSGHNANGSYNGNGHDHGSDNRSDNNANGSYNDDDDKTYNPNDAKKFATHLFYMEWDELYKLIVKESYSDPYAGLRLAEMNFTNPYLGCSDATKITYGVMKLLIKYIYDTGLEYGKLTLGYKESV
jgi:hypothetical protein